MTKREISDSILFKLAGGYPDSNFPVDERDIWAHLEHKINGKFKMQQYAENLPSGETIPDNLCLATYEDIAITSLGGGRSKSTLPVMPISLPKNAGIQMVFPVLNVTTSGDRTHGKPLIPLVTGQIELLQTDILLNDLMGRWGYTPTGKTLYYTKDLTLFGITKVDMRLVVFDMANYGPNDDLPVPADYTDWLEDELLKEFGKVAAEAGYVNIWSNAGQTAPINSDKK
jgi:hypothetical protein